MRIQHNITALNAANRLKANESTVSKNIQKLSSGYRINSAADDAAGLAVSEKMRKEINGLSQAEDNTKNGISLVQTAEGGLNETSSILQRMNTLAVESSNGTYKDEDRTNLQKEVDHLKTEIDRIANSTNFNEIKLLNGSLSATGSAAASTATISGIMTSASATAKEKTETGAVSALTANTPKTYKITYQDASGATKTTSVTLTWDGTAGAKISDGNDYAGTASASETDAETATAIAGALNHASGDITKAFTITANGNKVDFEAKTDGTKGEHILSFQEAGADLAGTKVTVNGADSFTQVANSSLVSSIYTGGNASSSVFSVNGQKFAFVQSGKDASALGKDVSVVYTAAGNALTNTATTGEIAQMAALISDKTGLSVTQNGTDGFDFKAGTSTTSGNALVFQVGAEDVDDQRAQLNIGAMDSKGLGIDGTNLMIDSQTHAQAAITTIANAVKTVNSTRADLGALQNELEHTANNLSAMNENLTSAESTIRDVDMTDEYVQYSKNQILSQAANAMLAQANTQPQNVLTLLKG